MVSVSALSQRHFLGTSETSGIILLFQIEKNLILHAHHSQLRPHEAFPCKNVPLKNYDIISYAKYVFFIHLSEVQSWICKSNGTNTQLNGGLLIF